MKDTARTHELAPKTDEKREELPAALGVVSVTDSETVLARQFAAAAKQAKRPLRQRAV